tara:strand:+ start:334 stop:618 length:285 start_codon:yes stop_codon:yes gene_type:complete
MVLVEKVNINHLQHQSFLPHLIGVVKTGKEKVMIDRTFLDHLPHELKEALAEDCEDFLLHRNIPLHSHSYDNIIIQAIKEGYQSNKFDRPIRFD